jgi:hypothetical protein
MIPSPRDRLGSSSPCKGEDRWGSAASTPSQTFEAKRIAGLAGGLTAYFRCRPATPSLTLPLSGGGNLFGEVDR